MEKRLKERNYGIDCLKIFSMMGIVMLHILNNGGVINNIAITRRSYIIINLLYTLSYASVNVFAIITGFLYSKKTKVSIKPLINLLIITIFYSSTITLVFFIFNINGVRFKGGKYILYGIFPFLSGRYWYITCYVFVFLLIKYLNMFVNVIEQREFLKLLIIVFFLIPVCTTLFGFVNLFLKDFKYLDLFSINNGYSPFWLVYCYLIGAYIRKFEININTKKNVILLFGCIGVSGVCNYLTKIITYSVFSGIKLNDLFISYISPFNVIISILLVLLFKKMTFKNELLLSISKATFGIYIIHTHIYIYDLILKKKYAAIGNENMFLIIIHCIIIDIAIFIICLIIDFMRKKLFEIIHIDYILEKITQTLSIIDNKDGLVLEDVKNAKK